MNYLQQKILGLFVKTNGLLSRPLYGGMGHIFMLHRVLPESIRAKYTYNYDLAITPEHLEKCILFFKAEDYEFLSLDEMLLRISGQVKSKRKFVVLTFDDGYRDNLEYGLPILKKHQTPGTIYVTNCYPNGTAILWWFLIEDVLRTQTQFNYRSTSALQTIIWSSTNPESKVFMQVRDLVKNTNASEFRQMIKDSFGIDEDEMHTTCKKYALTWSEIQQLAHEPLITIGAHTMNHLPLSLMQTDEAMKEMRDSKTELEEKTGKAVHHFAYPYGTFAEASTREYQLAKQVGFHTSTINYPGNIFGHHAHYPQSLPRMPLGNNVSEQKLRYIINGITHFGANGFKKVIPY